MTPLSMNQNTATASTTWNIKTNNQTGYTLSVNASSTPALQDDDTSEYFTDYTETTTNIPEVWNVSNAYEFGFSVYGTNVNTSMYGTDTNCISTTDIPSAELKYRGYQSTTLLEIASSTSETTMAGIDTTLCIAVEQDTVYAPSGFYQATTTATAVSN